MATYPASIYSAGTGKELAPVQKYTKKPHAFSFMEYAIEHPAQGNIGAVIHSRFNNLMRRTSYAANHLRTFADEFLFHRIWIWPKTFHIPLILDTVENEFIIWNAHRNHSVTLSGFDIDGDATGVHVPNPLLPLTLTWDQDVVFTLIVSPNGAVQLDTTFHFVHNGPPQDVQLRVAGLRALCLPLYHNWQHEYGITYSLDSTVASTLRLHEQRKSMQTRVRREISASPLFFDGSIMSNMLQVAANQLWIAPIETEPMHLAITGSIEGLQSLTMQEDLSKYFNLSLSTHLMIRNLDDDTDFFLGEITNIAGNTITFRNELAVDYHANRVCCYPVMLSTIAPYSIEALTSWVHESDIVLTEFIVHG
jgi:hypothetical protein